MPRGFGFHKDTYGPEGVSLGHEIAPMSYRVCANRRVFCQAVGRAGPLLRRGIATWGEATSLFGLRSWMMCSADGYGFVHDTEESSGVLEIPASTVFVFQTPFHVSVFFSSPLTPGGSWGVVMVDSSLEGAAACQARGSAAKVLAAARHCRARGWRVIMDSGPGQALGEDDGQEYRSEDSAPGIGWGAPVPVVIDAGPRVLVRVLYAFSGPRRNSDVRHCIQMDADRMGARFVV